MKVMLFMSIILMTVVTYFCNNINRVIAVFYCGEARICAYTELIFLIFDLLTFHHQIDYFLSDGGIKNKKSACVKSNES